ncbi:unnamed protein product, partial [Closterium sp. NIES-65]
YVMDEFGSAFHHNTSVTQYVMDEFGSAFRHSDRPNFRCAPFLFLPDGSFASALRWGGCVLSYSILWPVAAVRPGEECTRDYLAGVGEEHQRSPKLCVWFHTPSSAFHQAYEQRLCRFAAAATKHAEATALLASTASDNKEDKGGEGKASESADKPERTELEKRVYRVFTDLPYVTDNLSRPEFTFGVSRGNWVKGEEEQRRANWAAGGVNLHARVNPLSQTTPNPQTAPPPPVDTPSEADIIWTSMQVDDAFREAAGLKGRREKGGPEPLVNQFPFEACIVMKHHLAKTIQQVRGGDTGRAGRAKSHGNTRPWLQDNFGLYPERRNIDMVPYALQAYGNTRPWLQDTYNMQSEMAALIGCFKGREAAAAAAAGKRLTASYGGNEAPESDAGMRWELAALIGCSQQREAAASAAAAAAAAAAVATAAAAAAAAAGGGGGGGGQVICSYEDREVAQKVDPNLDNTWILKPWNLARSMDATVSRHLAQIVRLAETGPEVCQKYISRPALFHGRKFDLRKWVGWNAACLLPAELFHERKFDLRFLLLLKRLKPLEAYFSNVFWVSGMSGCCLLVGGWLLEASHSKADTGPKETPGQGRAESGPKVCQKCISHPALFHGRKFDLRFVLLLKRLRPLEAYLSDVFWAEARLRGRPDSLKVERGPKVCQKYISRPALFHGRKFDLRFLLLLKKLRPLEAYLLDVFWARIANKKYSQAEDSLSDFQTHFTVMNYSSHKYEHVPTHEFVQAFEQEHSGMDGDDVVWMGDDVVVTWQSIYQSVQRMLRELLAAAVTVHPEMQPDDDTCRAIYGVDVMLDDHFQPKLLEGVLVKGQKLEAGKGADCGGNGAGEAVGGEVKMGEGGGTGGGGEWGGRAGEGVGGEIEDGEGLLVLAEGGDGACGVGDEQGDKRRVLMGLADLGLGMAGA